MHIKNERKRLTAEIMPFKNVFIVSFEKNASYKYA